MSGLRYSSVNYLYSINGSIYHIFFLFFFLSLYISFFVAFDTTKATFIELQVFRFGTKDGKPADNLVQSHTYILQPVTGKAKYLKLQSKKSANDGQPLQKAVVNLDDVTLCISRVFPIFPTPTCFDPECDIFQIVLISLLYVVFRMDTGIF